MKRYALPIVILYVLVPAFNVCAGGLEAAGGRIGLAFLYNGSGQGAVSPLVTTLGASLRVAFRQDFFMTFEPSMDVLWTHYEWTGTQAVATEIERGQSNNVFVLGFVLDMPVCMGMRFSQRVGGSVSLGAALVMRVPIAYGKGNSAEMKYNRSAVAAYFWDKGRWIYPSAGLRLDIYVSERLIVELGLKGFLPLFNAWTPHNSFWDHSILSAALSVVWRL